MNKLDLVPLKREMLSVYAAIREICQRHNIRFFAAYGTALGAVRHKGFIPWDDDFDIEMPRTDYEKFLQVAEAELPSDLSLVSWGTTYGYKNQFAKIMVNDKTRLEKVESECGYTLGQGIFVDIFVVDGLPNTKLGRFWHLARRAWLKLREKFLPFRKDAHYFCAAHDQIMKENPFEVAKGVCELGWISRTRMAFKRKDCCSPKVYGVPRWMPFEDTTIPVPENVAEHLKFEFGDYMQLPPEDKRRASHTNEGASVWPLRLGALTVEKQPILSIVVANYNYGRYLDAALNSVFAQCSGVAKGPQGQNVLMLSNGEAIELIICDAKSKDNSVEIIKKYARRLAWWCSEKDGGQSAAFNKGFSHSAGKYLTWLNADDLMVAGSLLAVTNEMKRHPDCQWFTGNYFRFVPSGKVQQMNWGPNYYPKWLQWKCSPIVVFGPTTFFSKKIFDEAGGFLEELQNGMDNYLWVKFILAGIKQRRIRALIWAFRLHEESKTSDFEGHVRAQNHLDDADRDSVILAKLRSKKGLRFALFCVRLWRLIDFSFAYRFLLKLRYRHVHALIKGVPGLARKQFAVVHCMPTPYRNHMFAEMRKQLLAQNIDLWVHFMTKGLGGRPKDWVQQSINFPHKFWRDFGFGTHFFNPGLFFHILRNKPDWLLIGSPYDTFTGMFVTLLCKARGSKIVWCEGNTKNPGELGGFKGWLKRLVYSNADYAAVPGVEGSRFIRLHQDKTRKTLAKPIVLPNLVDETKFKPKSEWDAKDLAALRRQVGVSDEDRLCLIPARLVPVKGLLQFVEQLDSQLLAGWKVVILGNGPLREDLVKLINAKGLSQYVLLAANIAYNDMPKMYATSDLFLLPSIQDMNPLTVVEAVHSGLPLAVSCQAGNAPEAVTEDNNGWILPVNDSAQYKAKLLEVFGTPKEKLLEMGIVSKSVNAVFWNTEESVKRFLKDCISEVK